MFCKATPTDAQISGMGASWDWYSDSHLDLVSTIS